ncbi:hypothetical protein F4553_003112 [Allocatelliglobosispora scoriae]|uniref:Uncharacterized protein n=1 Tax=Allocatelliglobosispora scoriae TaxID=643052 RepID=A0A841BS47_9ACTN|nr:hypothetical protein [Allocatelliglobosispora scoriae]MBB5869733.1 hypothetical protein [Allocatelliglobosispora scoriae]
MKDETPPDNLREVLLESVPPLGEPADRIGDVGRRVRRARTRTIMATVATTVLVGAVALGVPTLWRGTTPQPVADTTAPVFDAARCPVAPAKQSGELVDKPGALVPDGALSVSLCELPLDPAAGTVPTPRTVTLRPGELVAALNALPTKEEVAAKLGQPFNHGCTMIGFAEDLSLVLTYADRAQVTVALDRNCGTAIADGRTRFMSGSSKFSPTLLDGFVGLYREQLAASTDAATVQAPACPATLTQAAVSGMTANTDARDGIARNRGSVDVFAPSALVEVRACRYLAGSGGTLKLTAQHAERSAAPAVRDLLNEATKVRENTDAEGGSTVTNLAGCAVDVAIGSLDVIWIADATGAVSEVRVLRAPCAEVRRAGMGGLVVLPELAGQLDGWLR